MGKKPKVRALEYRASRIELLERKHPGLLAWVEKMMEERIPQAEIARRVESKYGARLSPQRGWETLVAQSPAGGEGLP